jgi:hypothetical protein
MKTHRRRIYFLSATGRKCWFLRKVAELRTIFSTAVDFARRSSGGSATEFVAVARWRNWERVMGLRAARYTIFDLSARTGARAT